MGRAGKCLFWLGLGELDVRRSPLAETLTLPAEAVLGEEGAGEGATKEHRGEHRERASSSQDVQGDTILCRPWFARNEPRCQASPASGNMEVPQRCGSDRIGHAAEAERNLDRQSRPGPKGCPLDRPGTML